MTTYLTVFGNTFPVKDQLKALGGRWNAAERSWVVPADVWEQAQELVGLPDLPEGMSVEPTPDADQARFAWRVLRDGLVFEYGSSRAHAILNAASRLGR